jgi:luciferase family oxidoreductase group 1
VSAQPVARLYIVSWMNVELSILDLAPIAPGQTPTDSFANSVALAQRAEKLGYKRVWYAEHHNMASIASSATSVLIAHIGAHTERIRLGAGGVMLPNHAPLVIAEQFGTLAAMYPDRIDLGLGRAPGSDQNTMYALRRDPSSAASFPEDVRELQGYLTGNTVVPGVDAVPGKDSNVPLYILGSSMFGANLAAAFGLPYAFASHFSPELLDPAIAAYRNEFKPSDTLDRPYVIAGVNVLGTDTVEEAQEQLQAIRRIRAVSLYGRQRGVGPLEFSDDQADRLLAAGMDSHVDQMLTFTALGAATDLRAYLEEFAQRTGADELITTHQAPGLEARLRSVDLLAEAMLQGSPESAAISR